MSQNNSDWQKNKILNDLKTEMRNVLQTKIHFESISHRWTVIWREKQRHKSDILVPQCTCP